MTRQHKLENTHHPKKNLRRDNHYLPVCYQEGFANSEGRVWIKNAGGSKPELRKPSKVGRKRSLYIIEENGVETDRVEDFFDKTVESAFAVLSKRVKEEQNKFTQMSPDDVGTIARFVASQTVRTVGHKRTIEEQAGTSVDTNTFVRVMSRKMLMLLNTWIDNPPTFRFLTPLPNIGTQFITGDHPVVVMLVNKNEIWTPTDTAALRITDLSDILQRPEHAFVVSLSPYVAVSIQNGGTGEVHLPPQEIDPKEVRKFNEYIKRQCTIFTLARDRDYLN
jgi:hypothetical protein